MRNFQDFVRVVSVTCKLLECWEIMHWGVNRGYPYFLFGFIIFKMDISLEVKQIAYSNYSVKGIVTLTRKRLVSILIARLYTFSVLHY